MHGDPAVPGGVGPAVSWPELMAAMSLARDTAMALPLETGLATCLVAMRLAAAAGLAGDLLSRTYALAMLEHIGCTASSSDNAAVTGDELVMREHSAVLDFTDQRAMFRFMLGHVARVNPVAARPLALARVMAGGRRLLATADQVCEAARMLSVRCGYDPQCLADLDSVYEHWDGSGMPGNVSGDAIPVPVQVVQVATLAVNAERLMGAEAAMALVQARRGRALSPAIADVLLADPAPIMRPLTETESLWDAVLAADPAPSSRPARPAWTAPWPPWPTSPTSRRRAWSGTPPGWRAWPGRPPRRTACLRRRPAWSAGPGTCMTSGGWRCPPRCGIARGR
jgi:hypothetical protein